MSHPQRDAAVQSFMDNPNKTILLSRYFKLGLISSITDSCPIAVSLKAGGVGLNLTAGNRVILLDLGMYFYQITSKTPSLMTD